MVERAPEQVIVVEVPLLTDFMGPGWIRVVVDADPDTRTERLKRRGMDVSDASRRMAAQADRADWVVAADFVIDNSLDPDALGIQVDAFWERLAGVQEQISEDPDKR
jgi:dephospho-CoA kinase